MPSKLLFASLVMLPLALLSCGAPAPVIGQWEVDVEATRAAIRDGGGMTSAIVAQAVRVVSWTDCSLELSEGGEVVAVAKVRDHERRYTGRWSWDDDRLIITTIDDDSIARTIEVHPGSLDDQGRLKLLVSIADFKVPVILRRRAG